MQLNRFPPLVRLSPLTGAALLCMSVPLQAVAQSSASGQAGAAESTDIGRFEVTARRRLESALEIPASVSTVSGESLKATGATSVGDIVSQIPNVNYGENPRSFDTYISMRGMRQADTGAAPNFGMYRNGFYAGGRRVNLGSQVDVQRVEVLRGPQGGIYGRDAVGGAINVVYALPTIGGANPGYFTAAVEDTGTRLEGAAGGTLGANAAFRGTVWSVSQNKGDYYNITRSEYLDKYRDQGARLSGIFNLTPSLSGLIMFEAAKADTPGLRTYAPQGVANGPVVRSPAETLTMIQRDAESRNDVEQKYVSARLDWTLSGGTLSFIGSLRDYNLAARQDQDQTALKVSAGPLVLEQTLTRAEDIKQRYNELLWQADAVGGFSWRAGVSTFRETFGITQQVFTSLDTKFLSLIGLPIPNVGVISGSASLPESGSAYRVSSWSGFADVRYEFNKQLAGTFTLRRTSDEASIQWSQGIDLPASPIGLALFSSSVPRFKLDGKNKYSFTAPAAGLEFKIDRNSNAYVQYGTGFRPGGYNTTVSNPALIPYNQESATSLEAGYKLQFMEGRAALNLAVFRMNQKDMLVQQDDPTDNTFNFTYLANVGRARTNGVEFELLGRVDRKWNLGFSIGYVDAKYTEGLINAGTASAVNVTGRPLQGVRPLTANLRADYRGSIFGLDGSAGVSIRRESGGKIGDQSDIPLEGLTRVDLSASVKLMPQTSVGIYVRNALDQLIEVFRFANGASGTNVGRRVGLQLTHRF